MRKLRRFLSSRVQFDESEQGWPVGRMWAGSPGANDGGEALGEPGRRHDVGKLDPGEACLDTGPLVGVECAFAACGLPCFGLLASGGDGPGAAPADLDGLSGVGVDARVATGPLSVGNCVSAFWATPELRSRHRSGSPSPRLVAAARPCSLVAAVSEGIRNPVSTRALGECLCDVLGDRCRGFA